MSRRKMPLSNAEFAPDFGDEQDVLSSVFINPISAGQKLSNFHSTPGARGLATKRGPPAPAGARQPETKIQQVLAEARLPNEGYEKLFVKAGYEEIGDLAGMRKEDLIKMGVRPGHAQRILNFLTFPSGRERLNSQHPNAANTANSPHASLSGIQNRNTSPARRPGPIVKPHTPINAHGVLALQTKGLSRPYEDLDPAGMARGMNSMYDGIRSPSFSPGAFSDFSVDAVGPSGFVSKQGFGVGQSSGFVGKSSGQLSIVHSKEAFGFPSDHQPVRMRQVFGGQPASKSSTTAQPLCPHRDTADAFYQVFLRSNKTMERGLNGAAVSDIVSSFSSPDDWRQTCAAFLKFHSGVHNGVLYKGLGAELPLTDLVAIRSQLKDIGIVIADWEKVDPNRSPFDPPVSSQEVSKLEAQLREEKKETARLRQLLNGSPDELRSQNEVLSAKLQDATANLIALQSGDSGALQKTINDLRSQVEEKDKQLKSLTSRLEDARRSMGMPSLGASAPNSRRNSIAPSNPPSNLPSSPPNPKESRSRAGSHVSAASRVSRNSNRKPAGSRDLEAEFALYAFQRSHGLLADESIPTCLPSDKEAMWKTVLTNHDDPGTYAEWAVPPRAKVLKFVFEEFYHRYKPENIEKAEALVGAVMNKQSTYDELLVKLTEEYGRQDVRSAWSGAFPSALRSKDNVRMIIESFYHMHDPDRVTEPEQDIAAIVEGRVVMEERLRGLAQQYNVPDGDVEKDWVGAVPTAVIHYALRECLKTCGKEANDEATAAADPVLKGTKSLKQALTELCTKHGGQPAEWTGEYPRGLQKHRPTWVRKFFKAFEEQLRALPEEEVAQAFSEDNIKQWINRDEPLDATLQAMYQEYGILYEEYYYFELPLRFPIEVIEEDYRQQFKAFLENSAPDHLPRLDQFVAIAVAAVDDKPAWNEIYQMTGLNEEEVPPTASGLEGAPSPDYLAIRFFFDSFYRTYSPENAGNANNLTLSVMRGANIADITGKMVGKYAPDDAEDWVFDDAELVPSPGTLHYFFTEMFKQFEPEGTEQIENLIEEVSKGKQVEEIVAELAGKWGEDMVIEDWLPPFPPALRVGW
ncbi:hypothetical protein DIPPA_20287 [Diplonema papillatum]|nr:hypothetical protein DIPPA_20287 [Diplonema papillatum]